MGCVWRRGEHDRRGMRKKRRYLAASAVVLLGALVTAVLMPSREPAYDGRRLSDWVERSAAPSAAYAKRRDRVILDTSQAGFACAAIQSIGTNGLPYLLKWIRYEPPCWKRKLYGVVNRVLRGMSPSWQISDGKELRAYGAVIALVQLGPEAEVAVPELVSLAHDRNVPTIIAERAAVVVVLIPHQRENR